MEPNLSIHDYDVLDADGQRIGKVDALWADDTTDRLEFIGVKTGWIFGKDHLVPAESAVIDEQSNTVRIPYTKELVKEAPTMPSGEDIAPEDESRIYSYYSLDRPMRQEGMAREPLAGEPRHGGERIEGDLDVPLVEEEVRVGKREVPDERLRLRKVVRSEPFTEDVTLRREELEIERVPATGRRAEVPPDAFQEREYEARTMHEEPVVEKNARVTERVQAHRETRTDQAEVHGERRREDVEVDRDESGFRDRV